VCDLRRKTMRRNKAYALIRKPGSPGFFDTFSGVDPRRICVECYLFRSDSGATHIRIARPLAAKTAGKQHIAYKAGQFTTKIVAFSADFIPATSSNGVKNQGAARQAICRALSGSSRHRICAKCYKSMSNQFLSSHLIPHRDRRMI
jgi:hypothetical protein